MKLAIIGSRAFDDYDFLLSILRNHFDSDNSYPNEIISGGARGADSIGKKYALANSDIKYTEFLPDWDLHGKAAGFIRNELIIENCDMVLCFWDGVSKGTLHSINIAKKKKKPTFIYYI